MGVWHSACSHTRYRRCGSVHRPVLVCERKQFVDASKAEDRSEVITLGGVVVDNVPNDFDPGAVEGLDHHFELAQWTLLHCRHHIPGSRREKSQRVVATIVGQPAICEMPVADDVVYRRQHDRRDAEVGQDSQAGAGVVNAA